MPKPASAWSSFVATRPPAKRRRGPYRRRTLELVPVYDRRPPSWRVDAACRDLPVEFFFADPPHAAALAACARCPVSRPCLEFAIDTDCVAGVFGGLTADERRELD